MSLVTIYRVCVEGEGVKYHSNNNTTTTTTTNNNNNNNNKDTSPYA